MKTKGYMEKTKSNTLMDQAAILVIATLLSRFLGFLYRFPMTNIIGDQGNGYYGAGYQIYAFILILSSSGLPAAISKLVSERIALKRYNDAHAVFQAALFLSALMGIIFALILLFGAKLISNLIKVPLSYYSMIALSPTVLVVGISAVLRGYFQGMNTTKPTAVSQVIEQLFNAIFSVVLADLLIFKGPEFGAAGGTAGTGVGALAGLIVMIIIYKVNSGIINKRLKNDRLPPKESYYEIITTILKTAWPIIFGTAVFSISGLIDTSMISTCLHASHAFTQDQIDGLLGQYTGKFIVLTTLPVAISSAMATASVPSVASSNAINDTQAVSSKINMGIRMSMLLTIPAAIGLSVLGDPILRMLFGSNAKGGILLQWGGVAVIFLALVQIVTGMLQGINHIKLPIIGALIGAAVKIALNLVLIKNPQINVLGAVLSTIGCYLAASIIDVYFLWHVTRVRIDFVGILLKPVICAIGMGISSYGAYEAIFYLCGHNTVSVLVAIAFGVLVYFICMIFIKGIERADLYTIPMGNKIIRVLNKLRV